MSDGTDRKYWQSMQQRDGLPIVEPPQVSGPASVSRRRFLEAAGFTLSAVAMSGCGRAPTETALPFVNQPEGMTPGRMRSYASTCGGCAASCGLLVGVRDGRPLKMEGMPSHPLSGGGLCATGQALPLGLYDSHRLQNPLSEGQPSSWKDVDLAITQKLSNIADAGGAVRFVTSTVTSPTLQSTIDSFLERFTNAKHVTFDAVSSSAILDAHEQTHGVRVLPHYRLERAKVIVSFGADFLGTWISPVEFTTAWRSRRTPTAEHPEMSYHVHLEGGMSLTGGKAERRYRLSPNEYGAVLSQLAIRLAKLAGQTPPPGDVAAAHSDAIDLDDLADRLWKARGAGVVLSDSQDTATQVLVNHINQLLDNYGATVDLTRPSRQRQGNDREVLAMLDELKSGQVAALFVAGTDLTHNLPGREELIQAIEKVSLVVSFAERSDDFSGLAHFVCPDHHPLESWLDSEPVQGLVSLSQPTVEPLGGTRSILESLSRWSERNDSAYDILRSHWKQQILPRAGAQSFQRFWDQAVHDGFAEVKGAPVAVSEYNPDVVQLSTETLSEQSSDRGFTLSLHSKLGITDSRHAHNPWLQELPDPVTKVTWDNYVSLSPGAAEELGIEDGDVVRVEAEDGGLELPALVQPGQHDRVISIALGYGVKGTDRFEKIGPQWIEARPTVSAGETVGKNAARFLTNNDGTWRYDRCGVSLVKTGRTHPLASSQDHHRVELPPEVAPHGGEKREQIQETNLAAYRKDPAAGKPEEHHHGDVQLWPEDHTKEGHAWGMGIDLNACSGCSACVIACQSENNIPVVGKDEVARHREMHWMRIDRYYSGEEDEIDVSHQPMMCQHCDNAPCETVCPVLATVHGEEGLNEQAYNRCVGTRYCANNCPYKVRRFNWFEYSHDDPLQNLSLNPDVTVRTRGVMEKCSMCVQRIEEGKITARSDGRPVADGEIQTACQQSCPAQAIVFGDMNDPDSQIHKMLANPRRYRVLEELNVRPAVSYLRVVRNRDEEETVEGGEHV